MIEIILDNQKLDLPHNFSLPIEESNPIFNERGSQSLPVTVPATAVNRRALGFPEMLTTNNDRIVRRPNVTINSGHYRRSGLLNMISASRKSGYSFNIGLSNSVAYAEWQNKKLPGLSSLPEEKYANVDELIAKLGRLRSHPEDTPWLAIFPIVVDKAKTGGETVWEFLNVPEAFDADNKPVCSVIDGKVMAVKCPKGYGIAPFLRVWRLLELCFDDMGFKIENNPLRDDGDLERLVVLHNTADSVTTGTLRYSELVPDCTVSEFMNALWVRFGLTYTIDWDLGVARVELLRNILQCKSLRDIDDLVSGPATINYESFKYVKLSASTALEGAKPICERWEDFLGSGRVYVDLIPTQIEIGGSRSAFDSEENMVFLDIRTGIWNVLNHSDEHTKLVASGSSFFNWNPMLHNSDALELNSIDECVPLGSAYIPKNYSDSTQWRTMPGGDYPLYLCGSVHRHTKIIGLSTDETADSTWNKTPLAFLFAYNCEDGCFGRNSAAKLKKVTYLRPPEITLYFQFADGLYANFWRDYDEIIRQSSRTVEVSAVVNVDELHKADMFSPVRFSSVRCLYDTITYALPEISEVNIKLRPLQAIGENNSAREVNVPGFSFSAFYPLK